MDFSESFLIIFESSCIPISTFTNRIKEKDCTSVCRFFLPIQDIQTKKMFFYNGNERILFEVLIRFVSYSLGILEIC